MAKTYSIKTVFEVLDRAASPLNKIGTAFAGVARKVNTMSKNLEKAGKKMDAIGKKMSTRLTLPLVGLATASSKASMDFNELMANVATLIPKNLPKVEALKKGVQNMAIEMGKSTSDLADGLYQVISAFGDTDDALDRLKIVSTAATAGLASTGDTLNLLSQITKDYGDTSLKGMTKASDLAFLAVKEGQTSFQALAQSMSMVIPTASKMKISQEELFATMAAFTRGAQTTPMIVTQLNAVLTALASPTKAMEKRFHQLGVKSGSLMIEQKGLAETMRLLTKNGKASNEELIELFGNVRAGRLAMSFAGAGGDEFAEKLKKMGEYANTTSTAFNEMTDGINKNGFTWKKFLSLLQVVGQEIGDTLGPLLVDIIGILREWIQKFRDLSPEGRKTVLMIAGIVAAIGPALIILGKLSMGLGFVMKALTATTAAGTPLVSVLGTIAAAVGTVYGAVFALNKLFDILKEKFDKIFGTGKGKGIAEALTGGIPVISQLAGFMRNIDALKKSRLVESAASYSPDAMKNVISNQGQIDLNVKVSAEPGSSAVIDKVKRKGKSKVKLNNESSLGMVFAQ